MLAPRPSFAFFRFASRWMVILVLWALMLSMARGNFGMSNYLELKRNKEYLESLLDTLEYKNQLLSENLEELKTNKKAQIRFLKEEFGFLEPDEAVFFMGD